MYDTSILCRMRRNVGALSYVGWRASILFTVGFAEESAVAWSRERTLCPQETWYGWHTYMLYRSAD